MCHENFTMYFGPNVNFISGHNGSGKSASLQALQCCLGVQARKTGRGTNLRGFVRKGAPRALAQVMLWNVGEDAYRPETFGNLIVVERRIEAAGGSRFTMKSQRGDVVATSKAELEKLLDHMNVLIANPCVVMTQDHARTFLGGSVSDGKKYELFMKATMLDQVIYNLNTTKASLDKMFDLLQLKIKEYRKQEKALKGLEDKIEEARRLEDVRTQRDALEALIAWGQIFEEDRRIAEAVHKRDVVGPEALTRVESKISGFQRELEEARQEQASMAEAIKEYEEGASGFHERIKAQQQRVSASRRNVAQANRRLTQITQERSENQEKKQSIQEALAESNEELIASTQAARQTLEQQREQQQQEKSSVTAELDRLKAQSEQLFKDKEALREKQREVEHGVRQAREEIQEKERHLKRLQDSSKNGAARLFGEWVPQAKDLIRRNLQQFEMEPVGPVGLYLTLKDDKWATVVEGAIGRSQGTWLVSSAHDERLLRDLLRQTGAKRFTVVTTNFKQPLHAYRRGGPSSVPCILDVLSCSRPEVQNLVLNFLIDSEKVETKLLFESDQEAEQYIFSARTHMQAYTLQMRYLYWKGASQNVRHMRGVGSPRLVKDNARVKARLGEEIASLRGRLQATQRELGDAAEAVSQTQRELDTCDRQQEELEGRRAQVNHSIQETLTQQHMLLQQPSGEGLEAELNALNAQDVDLAARELSAGAALEEARRQQELLQATLDEQVAEFESLQSSAKQYEAEVGGITERIDEAQKSLSHYKAQKQTFEAKLQTLAQQCAEQEVRRREMAAQAAQICREDELEGMRAAAKVRETEGMEVLQKALRKASKHIEVAEKNSGGSMEEFQVQAEELRAEVELRRTKVEQVKAPYLKLDRTYQDRYSKYHTTLGDLKKQVSFAFNEYMAKKGHTGSCKFDDEAAKLSLNVRMNNAAKRGSKVSDMKSLSGGERSFSTLAFTLALGRLCESPFRASDEFDVFMDAVSRTVTLKTLLSFAWDHRHVQFLFLTPQDISAADDILQKMSRELTGGDLPEDFMKVIQMKTQRA